MTQYRFPKKRCKLVKACHQPEYEEAVVERWDELNEANLIRESLKESEAKDNEILTQMEDQDKRNSNLERRERDPTRQSSSACDQLRTGGIDTDAHLGWA